MKIKIIAGTFINGDPQKVGTILDLDDKVAKELINNYKAEKITDAEYSASKKKEEGGKEK